MVFEDLHRFQNQRNRVSEGSEPQRKKIQTEEKSKRRRRKKNFQWIAGRKPGLRRSMSSSPVLHEFHFAPSSVDELFGEVAGGNDYKTSVAANDLLTSPISH